MVYIAERTAGTAVASEMRSRSSKTARSGLTALEKAAQREEIGMASASQGHRGDAELKHVVSTERN